MQSYHTPLFLYWFCCYITICNSFTFLDEHLAGCISYHEAIWLVRQRTHPLKKFMGSIDLGYSKRELYVKDDGISIDMEGNEVLATWDQLQGMTQKKTNCYALYTHGKPPWKISTISPTSQFPASLFPQPGKPGPPTLVLGGFTMHRIKGHNVDPMTDTLAKVNSLKILPHHRILDTCTGLGYTAIEAAKRLVSTDKASTVPTGSVTTIEIDEISLTMASYNPWSQALFNRSYPIESIQGDTCEVIKAYPDNSFDMIIHDPPARAICNTDLYSQTTYAQFARILKKTSGRLFHYIGNPDSTESGRLYKGVKERLQVAGFRQFRVAQDAFGIIAYS
jgi:predicted methyltransferase